MVVIIVILGGHFTATQQLLMSLWLIPMGSSSWLSKYLTLHLAWAYENVREGASKDPQYIQNMIKMPKLHRNLVKQSFSYYYFEAWILSKLHFLPSGFLMIIIWVELPGLSIRLNPKMFWLYWSAQHELSCPYFQIQTRHDRPAQPYPGFNNSEL